jgi:hypothetical protein
MIKLELTPEEVQVVINALAQMPYAQVAGLIPKLIAQANPKEGIVEKPDLKEVK